MTTIFRRATPADVAAIAAFNQAMAQETENKTLATGTILAGVERMISDPSLGFYLVAEADGGPVGCLGITFEWSDWRNGLFWWIQ
ncbi:MAG: GNAT family N-acetyltransferase, partial [SAR86 cluster bacterium]|nr:GNAT family N-acetyltransferase [SAR86 cluster bacterium]